MWSFETDPEYQADLDWADEFVREEIEPLAFVIPNMLDITDPVRQELIPPLQAQVKERGSVGHATWAPSSAARATGRSSSACSTRSSAGRRCRRSSSAARRRTPATPRSWPTTAPRSTRQRYLQPLLDGQVFSTYSMTEPQAGSDPKEFTCRAELDGDEWVINGEKWFSSNARWAAFLIVMVDHRAWRRRLTGGTRCSSCPTDTPGVNILRNVGVAGWDAEGEGGPRLHPLRERARAGREPARRPGRRLRRGPDPPGGRAHPPRHADRRMARQAWR